MVRKLLFYGRAKHRVIRSIWADHQLGVVLWSLWTLAVLLTGYWQWHADHVAQHQLNLLGLIIHCSLARLIGMVVLTKIEMHFEPWRFSD
jgi:hypothetical protein